MSQSLWPLVIVAVSIIVLAVTIYLIRSWLRENDGPAASAHDLLSEYREMNRRGELSDEEFRIIKGRMAGQIRGAVNPSPPTVQQVEKQEEEKE